MGYFYIKRECFAGWLVTVLFVSTIASFAQTTNLGFPAVVNYYKKDIKSGAQTWDISATPSGFTYFANNSGLLIFDGYQWEILPLPNHTIVRSMKVGQDGTVYVGGQGEFGYFKPNSQGKWTYTSLSAPLLKAMIIEDVWDIELHADGVFFRTDKQVFLFANGQTRPLFEGEHALLFLGNWNGNMVVQDATQKLLVFEHGHFVSRTPHTDFTFGRISGMLKMAGDTVLLTTMDNGIFYETPNGFLPWKTSDDSFLKQNSIYCAARLPDNRLLVGTSFGGLALIDKQHRIEQWINKKHGLQNNTVLSMGVTEEGNVWVGLDNGIDLIDLKSPFRYYSPDGSLEGTSYAAILHQNRLYFGMNTGLYSLPWKSYYTPAEKENATLVSGTRGQVWSLNKMGDDLLMGHHLGAFHIRGTESSRVPSSLTGIWKFVSVNERTAIAGHYSGLARFVKTVAGWKEDAVIRGFTESARILSLDEQQNLWVSHPYRGLYQIPNNQVGLDSITPQKISEQNSFGMPLNNTFHVAMGKLIFSDARRFYLYDTPTQKLTAPPLLDFLPSPEQLHFLNEDDYHTWWFGTVSQTFFLETPFNFQLTPKKYTINGITDLLPGGFETVISIDRHHVLFPIEKGFLFFDVDAYTQHRTEPSIFLSRAMVTLAHDSVLYSAHSRVPPLPFSLPAQSKHLRFFFSVKSTSLKEKIKYSYLMKGLDSQWSNWTNDPFIEFTNLPPGHYTLLAKVKDITDQESKPIEIRLHILYPWYRSWWAYLGYITCAGGLLFVFYIRQQAKHRKEKESLLKKHQQQEEIHQLNALASREEITRLQNEKLTAEIKHKDQELTSFTYHLVNKNELISKIVEAVRKVEQRVKAQPDLVKELKSIIRLTEQNANVDEDWENFIKSFDQVHSDFYHRLHHQFPDLSPSDYKLCTYLRMNLTSKEIAALLNISIRSVETHRYRLRKKLGLHSDENLTNFLIHY